MVQAVIGNIVPMPARLEIKDGDLTVVLVDQVGKVNFDWPGIEALAAKMPDSPTVLNCSEILANALIAARDAGLAMAGIGATPAEIAATKEG